MSSNTFPPFVVTYARIDMTDPTNMRVSYVAVYSSCQTLALAEERARECVKSMRNDGDLDCLPYIIQRCGEEPTEKVRDRAESFLKGRVAAISAKIASVAKNAA